jgi:hypothetical protein|tara:strand:+ start:4260 stop:5438 length:1179 start_codon:yes stop_codon:yes gene_type:complete
MGLITETNEEYYAGEKTFLVPTNTTSFATTFNTELTLDSSIGDSNFLLEISTDSGTTYNKYVTLYPAGVISLSNNNRTVNVSVAVTGSATTIARITLTIGAVENNYGGYQYVKLNDIINTFIATYVGTGKLIPSVKRTDVIFHAKRGLQEFSYDTLKSIKSQEVSITPSLSMIIPQDYVNYIRLSWTDAYGIKHIIYPSDNLTIKPTDVPLQTVDGDYIQDEFGSNTQGTSETSKNWDKLNQRRLSGGFDAYQFGVENYYGDSYMFGPQQLGMRYGALPETTQVNGYFTMDPARGTISFSSDMNGRKVVLEYLSDGLAYDTDSKVPKMAEEAMYMHIAYSILAGRSGVQEYIVQRFKKDRRAALRNTKIRLSDIKLDQIVRIMRNKSKWIKH